MGGSAIIVTDPDGGKRCARIIVVTVQIRTTSAAAGSRGCPSMFAPLTPRDARVTGR